MLKALKPFVYQSLQKFGMLDFELDENPIQKSPLPKMSLLFPSSRQVISIMTMRRLGWDACDVFMGIYRAMDRLDSELWEKRGYLYSGQDERIMTFWERCERGTHRLTDEVGFVGCLWLVHDLMEDVFGKGPVAQICESKGLLTDTFMAIHLVRESMEGKPLEGFKSSCITRQVGGNWSGRPPEVFVKTIGLSCWGFGPRDILPSLAGEIARLGTGLDYDIKNATYGITRELNIETDSMSYERDMERAENDADKLKALVRLASDYYGLNAYNTEDTPGLQKELERLGFPNGEQKLHTDFISLMLANLCLLLLNAKYGESVVKKAIT